jgi:tetratricopeptide (TPR) repeat protein
VVTHRAPLLPAIVLLSAAPWTVAQTPPAVVPPQPVPQAIPYPAVPGALPPGLYRAGAVPLPPPAFTDLGYYYNSGYAPYGGTGYWVGGLAPFSPRKQLELAQVPYRAAVRDAQDFHYLNQVYRRDQALLARNASLTDEGTALLRAGLYQRAAVTLLAAAEANHDDALSRVRAGHALFALGRYDEATRHIGRAFELQPPLATLTYDLRDDYGRQSDFQQHLAALEQFVARQPRSPGGTTMLAYVRYYTTGPSSAYSLLRTAKRLDPRNGLVDRLLAVSAQVYSANRVPAPAVVPPTPTTPPTRTTRPGSLGLGDSDMRQARLDSTRP